MGGANLRDRALGSVTAGAVPGDKCHRDPFLWKLRLIHTGDGERDGPDDRSRRKTARGERRVSGRNGVNLWELGVPSEIALSGEVLLTRTKVKVKKWKVTIRVKCAQTLKNEVLGGSS